MRINLCDIIEMPGRSLPFSREMETARLEMPAIARFLSAPLGQGIIKNTAGALNLNGTVTAKLLCFCDRCGKEFQRELLLPLDIKLADSPEDDENPDIFALDGDELDLDDVLETSFILNADTKFLCKEDCAGLCSRCGQDLNEGPCSCEKEIDPRLAVLRQLLDN